MRRYVLLTTLALVACSGESTDAGVALDAGTTVEGDAGLIPVVCGASTCGHPREYCRATPSGACVATDGGACVAPEVECRDEATLGCTSPQTNECVDLPMDCDACGACLILASPCGEQIVTVDCSSSPTSGVRVQCPFP